MSARVHKVVSKVELNDRSIKTEIQPNDGDNSWVLVEGAPDVTVVEGFRAENGPVSHAVTWWKPNDAIRFRIRQDIMEENIELRIDRERGGEWWPSFNQPTIVVAFDSNFHRERKIRILVKGGDLKSPVLVGEVALLPPAKSDK